MELTLNLTPGKIRPPINVVQGDTGTIKQLTVYLIDGSTEYTIPTDASVVFQGTKPDNHGFSYPCEFEGSAVTVNFSEQATAVAGSFPVELQITEGTTNRIRSASATMVVSAAALADSTLISGDDYQALVTYVEGAAASATAAAASADAAATSETAGAASASAAASSASAAALSATQASASAGNAATSEAAATEKATAADASAASAAASALVAQQAAGTVEFGWVLNEDGSVSLVYTPVDTESEV